MQLTVVLLLLYYLSVGPAIDGNIQFAVTTSRDAQPSVFTLSFNVTQRPPTNILCTFNSTSITLSASDIYRRSIGTLYPNLLVEVQVTIRMRASGVYQCTVLNARVDNLNVFPADTNNMTVTGESYCSLYCTLSCTYSDRCSI